MTKFKEAVVRAVKLIPYGKVASYGQIAVYAGMPRAARQVGWILNGLSDLNDVPWWRVVNNSGRISIKNNKISAEEQKQLLREEGLKIGKDFTFDIEQYRFTPDKNFTDKLELDSYYFDNVLSNIPYSKNYFKK